MKHVRKRAMKITSREVFPQANSLSHRPLSEPKPYDSHVMHVPLSLHGMPRKILCILTHVRSSKDFCQALL